MKSRAVARREFLISPLAALLCLALLTGSVTAMAQSGPPRVPIGHELLPDPHQPPGRRAVGMTLAPPVPSVAALSREFIEQQRQAAGRRVVNMTPDGHRLGILPPPMDMSHIRPRDVSLARLPVGYPASFDLRNQPSPKLTGVKNQGSIGSCWAFASYASLESCLLPGELWDFSENHLKNTHGFDYGHGDGGQEFMSSAYLARWDGPASEDDDPYNPSSGVSPANPPVKKHVQEVLWLARDPNEVKWALYNHGAVYCTYYHANSSFNSSTNAYYYSGTNRENHGVAIVGWDDNYSRLNFRTEPPGDGAWIMKNSWGTEWGEGGYFYMSYHDKQLKRFVLFRNAEPVTNYARVYQYDPLGWVSAIGYNVGVPIWAANVFTASQVERLAAVGFYATDNVGTYEMYIYRNVGSTPTVGTLAASTSGSFTHAGYMTVPLATPVDLCDGARFSVVIKLTTPNYGSPAAIEWARGGYSSAAIAEPGQSYYSDDGTSWKDLTTLNSTANACIKAFTMDVPPPAVSVVNPDAGTNFGSVDVTIGGTGFRTGATAKLTRTGQADIGATDLTVVSATEIMCAFDIQGAEAGTWNVVVTNDDSQSGRLGDGFTIDVALLTRPFATGWHRMSIPGETVGSEPSEVLGSLGEANVDWLLHDYVGGRYYRYPHPSAREFAAGRGFWLRAVSGGTLEVASAPVDPRQPFEVDLPAGWSILGCPFETGVPWDDAHVQVEHAGRAFALTEAVAAGWLHPTIYAYEDGRNVPIHPTTSPGNLEPWQGYLINTGKEIRLVLTADTGQTMATTGLTSQRRASRGDWRMRLVAAAGGFSDAVVVGWRDPEAKTAANDRSAVLSSEPHPPVGPGVSIFLASAQERRDGSPGDALDLRSGAAGETRWEFTVQSTDAHLPVKITWPDLTEVPHDLIVYIEDLMTGQRLHMRTVGGYTFRPDSNGEQRQFRLQVKPWQPSAGMVTSLTAFGTANGGAEVVFALSDDALVDVTVMNIAGRVVRQVAWDRISPSGLNRLVWDGRGNSGAPVPNGRYLVHVTARTDDGYVSNSISSLAVLR